MPQGWSHVHESPPANVHDQDSGSYADDPSFVPTMGLRGSDSENLVEWGNQIASVVNDLENRLNLECPGNNGTMNAVLGMIQTEQQHRVGAVAQKTGLAREISSLGEALERLRQQVDPTALTGWLSIVLHTD